MKSQASASSEPSRLYGQTPSDPPAPRDVRVFLCYRRNDGSWFADWLNELLDRIEYLDAENVQHRIRFYYDKTAPGVANWKEHHFPSLQTAHALLLICTPGIATNLKEPGRPDWVYEELQWWASNRGEAPIVVDTTGEGERWLPTLIRRKWPHINRIDLTREAAEKSDAAWQQRMRDRIIDTLLESHQATLFEDLERSKRLARRLVYALAAALVLLVGTVTAAALAMKFSRTANDQRKSAVARLLVTQADNLRNEQPEKIELSVLLAAEAYAKSRSAEAARALQAGLALLPRLIARLPHDEGGLITNLIFSPDGKYLASSARDSTARLWDARNGRPLFTSRNHDVVLAMAFSLDGQYVATGSGDLYCGPATYPGDELYTKDSTARVLRVPSGEVVATFRQASSILAVAFSPDARMLATGGCDSTARIWDVRHGSEIVRLRHGSTVQDIAFHPNGFYIATASKDGVRLWAGVGGREVFRRGEDRRRGNWIESIAFSPDGTLLAAGTTGKDAYLWSVPTGDLVLRITHSERAHHVSFSPDGKYLATVSYDNTVTLWQVPEGRIVARFVLEESGYGVAFSIDGKYLAVSQHSPIGHVWAWADNREVARIVNPAGSVSIVAFSPDGRVLATGSHEEDHAVRIWQLPHTFVLDTANLLSAACVRVSRNITRDEWRQILGDEPYTQTCPDSRSR